VDNEDPMSIFNDEKFEKDMIDIDFKKEQELTWIAVVKEVDENNCFISDEMAKKFTDGCWICLMYDCSFEDPLISACVCSGTMKYIHLKCL